MCSLLIIYVLLTCAFGAPQKRAGVPILDGRIIGGKAVYIEEYPYQASLQYYYTHICGAAIISESHVVTTAYCTDGLSAFSLKIRVGSSIHNSGGLMVAVKEIFQHPSYDDWNVDYDISVLQLATVLSYNTAVSYIKLPGVNEVVNPGTVAYCTGWGSTSEEGHFSSWLQGIMVPILSHESCVSAYGAGVISERMICAGVRQGGKDACQGDSGSPLVANGKLRGIVSWGYGCARPSYPGVYSNIAAEDLRSHIKRSSSI